MKRSRFMNYGAAVALSACGGHGGLVPAGTGGATGEASASGGYMPAAALPAIPLLGECRRFDGAVVPTGWALCDGSVLPISQNPNLFKILGKSAGGDGKKTFALPHLATFRFVIAVAGSAPSSPTALAAFFTARQAQSRRSGAATVMSVTPASIEAR
jgi:hypothetical protein